MIVKNAASKSILSIRRGAVGALVASVFSATAALAQEAIPPWVGAWRWVNATFDGTFLLVEDASCYVWARKDRPEPQGNQPTVAEAAALFRAMPGPSCNVLSVASASDGLWVLDERAAATAHPGQVGSRSRWIIRVEGNRILGTPLRDDGSLGSTVTGERRSGPGNSPLAGPWRLVSDEWDGLMLMTDTEYRYVVAHRSRPEMAGAVAELTEAEAAALYYAFDAQGGTFTVSDSIMTRRPEVAKDPREQGRELEFRFRTDGNVLTTERRGERLTWRRPK